ncbi:hypothetical protein [Spirillospora sp. CA-128828]|uniref:hypothetical protein n=1 Tax=Spirillospora sp. CA-128828 TaxID=3240033 RepID=UPI003D92761B
MMRDGDYLSEYPAVRAALREARATRRTVTVGITIDYVVTAVVDVTSNRTEHDIDCEIGMKITRADDRR